MLAISWSQNKCGDAAVGVVGREGVDDTPIKFLRWLMNKTTNIGPARLLGR